MTDGTKAAPSWRRNGRDAQPIEPEPLSAVDLASLLGQPTADARLSEAHGRLAFQQHSTQGAEGSAEQVLCAAIHPFLEDVMTISPEALEKARAIAQSICNNTRTLIGENDIILIAAALQAERDAAAPKLPDDLAGLVTELEGIPTGWIDSRLGKEGAVAIQSLVARIAELEAGLEDLLSWFPDKPSEPEWRIKAGNYGADDAVSIARSLLNKDRQP